MAIETNRVENYQSVRKQIPSYLFWTLFNGRFDKEILQIAENHYVNKSSTINNAQELVVLMICHPEISAYEYLNSNSNNNASSLTIKQIFEISVSMGDLKTLEWIKNQVTPIDFASLIKNEDYAAFRRSYDKPDILKWFGNQVSSSELILMIKACNYDVFTSASSKGNLESLEWLKSQVLPMDLRDMIQFKYYQAFRNAGQNGHIDILQWLKEQVPDELGAMFESEDCQVFYQAALYGHLETLKWLIKNLTEIRIYSQRYLSDYIWNKRIFNGAIENGNVAILDWFKNQVSPIQFEILLKESNYDCFLAAILSKKLNSLKWLVNQLTSDQYNLLFLSKINQYFRYAYNNQYTDIMNWLLNVPKCFVWVDKHYQISNDQSYFPFVNDFMASLHQEHENSLINNPNIIFDIHDPEKAKLCFYIIRHFIWRNERSNDDEIRFLLDIPAVRALAHQEVSEGNSNELLKLAYSLGNREASAILLNIDAVRNLAELNDFYSMEVEGGFDLRQLALDSESSMTALSVGESKRLAAAIALYQPMINQAGINHIMTALRDTLVNRYERHPAKVTVNGALINLPLDYNSFQDLNLNTTDYQLALQAYFKHPEHTVWRYLSKPNPWMHPDASYVLVNEEDPSQRWSTFEDYQPLIAMFYLAAIDTETPATDGFTIKRRLKHFIQELALIARAHNWDKTRLKNNHEEEYDDLEADRPSCFSGVKRRLFQSVLGHPLLKILTKDDIEDEIRDFAREYFKSKITEDNKLALKTAFEKYCETLEDTYAEPLQVFNIPEVKQKEFEHYLAQKYGAQFTEDGILLALVRNRLLVQDKKSISNDASEQYHFLKLDGLTKFSLYLTQQCGPVTSNNSFFSQGRVEQSIVEESLTEFLTNNMKGE